MASYLVFPLFVLSLAAIAVLAASVDVAALFGLAPQANEPLALLLILPPAYALIACLERRWPHREEWNRSHGDVRTDVAHLLLSGISSNQLFQATGYVAALSLAAELSSRFGLSLWPVSWPLLAQLALALLVAGLGHYWFHRWSHEVALLWRVHAPHHSAPRLYWLNATRFHPLDLFALLTFQTVPLILMGADRRALLLYAVFTAVYGQLQHGNIELETGPLRWLFATPDLHRWHHSTDAREGNNNYGAVLSVWDWIFGSFFYPGRFAGRVGIGSMPDFPTSWSRQLVAPFRSRLWR